MKKKGMNKEESKASDLVSQAEVVAHGLVDTATATAKNLVDIAAEKEKSVLLLLTQHFKQDDVNFGEIRNKQNKYEELLRISGDHMSHMRKDVTELKTILYKQNESANLHNEESNSHRELIAAHMKRVEPMIVKYERNNTADDVNREKGMKIAKAILVISAIITALYVIKDAVIKILIR